MLGEMSLSLGFYVRKFKDTIIKSGEKKQFTLKRIQSNHAFPFLTQVILLFTYFPINSQDFFSTNRIMAQWRHQKLN